MSNEQLNILGDGWGGGTEGEGEKTRDYAKRMNAAGVETTISDIRNRKDCNNDLQIINEKSAMLNKEAEDVLIYQENI